MKKEKKRTVVPGFFSRRPLLPHAQKFSSSPGVASLHTPADMASSNSSELSLPVSQETNLSSDVSLATRQLSDTAVNPIPHTPRTILYNRSFKLPSPAKKLPDSPASKSSIEKKRLSPNESRESPLSFLALEDTIENIDKLDVAKLYLFIFNFLFGDEHTRKKCAADFFNSPIVVDPRISDLVKQYFYRIILQTLNPKPKRIKAEMLYLKPIYAKMLLGLSADERLLPTLTETLRYLTQEMPRTKDIDVKAYITAIADGKPPGEFPYDDIEQEKFDFLRHELQQNYDSFECIFTANDISPIGEANSFFKIQRWLYSELSYQFVLSKNRGIIERIRSELPSDDESEDESEEKIQEPSKLTVTHSDLRQALYQHLKTLLKKNKSLSTSSTKTAFLLVYQLSFEWIHKNTEETELNALFDLLLQTSAGIRFLCAIKDAEKERPMKKWLVLLEENVFKLFDKILSILPRLNSKQVLALLHSTLIDLLIGRISREQKFQFLHSLLSLNLPAVDMHICENSELMRITKKNGLTERLRESIWHSFSLESLETKDDEGRRAFLSDDRLIVENNKALTELLDRPILNKFLCERFHNIQFVLKINTLQQDWIIAYKKIYRLILDCWRPSDRDLDEISHIKEEWSNTMIKRLLDKTSDYSAYNPQNYTVDKLPQTMRAALEDKIEVLTLYHEQLGIMADYHHRLLACVPVPYDETDTLSSTLENRIPFIELMGTLAAQKGIKCTKPQIQACAEDLSRWFKEVIATGEVYPFEPLFFDLTKNSSKTTDVLYLSTRYAQLFLELLENAIPKKSSLPMFSSTSIILREKETKDAIEKLLSVIIKQESAQSSNKASPSLTIFRSPPATPRVERMRATRYPLFSP